jgi:hypothetical protein
MKPLVLLLVVFASASLASFISGKADYFFCGRLAMAVMLMFTSISKAYFDKINAPKSNLLIPKAAHGFN